MNIRGMEIKFKELTLNFFGLGTSLSIENTKNIVPPESIKSMGEYYVYTSKYEEARKILKNENIVTFIGLSGSGKSITSKMLAYHFNKEEKYTIKSVPSTEEYIKYINDKIKKNTKSKEIFIFDDIFGSTQTESSQEYFDRLESLLKEIEVNKNNKNKKFIFNSRKNIFQSVRTNNCKLITLMEGLKVFDLDELKTEEEYIDRVCIIYGCFKEYDLLKQLKILNKENIWTNEIYQTIIEHQNFTPLVINRAIKNCVDKELKDYTDTIMKALENPEDIWETEIKPLDKDTRKYLDILCSFPDRFINKTIIDECYEKYNADSRVSLNDIHICIKSLLVVSQDEFWGENIRFKHSSIREYLIKKLVFSEINEIKKSAVYIEQIECLEKNNIIKNLMFLDENGEIPFLKYKVLPSVYTIYNDEEKTISIKRSIYIKYLKKLYDFKIEDKKLEPIVIAIMEEAITGGILESNIQLDKSNALVDILKLNYDFSSILSNEKYIKKLYEISGKGNMGTLISLTEIKDDQGYDYLKMKDYVQDAILGVMKSLVEEVLRDWTESVVDGYVQDIPEYEDEENDTESIIESVKEQIYDDFKVNNEFKLLELSRKLIKESGVYNLREEEINTIDLEECDIDDIVRDRVC
jgi:hypothetical protein